MSKSDKVSLSMKEWQSRRTFSTGTLARAMKRAVQNEEEEVLIGTSQGQACYLTVDLPKKTTTKTDKAIDA